ncbi:hypothetical protein CCH79_00018407, partial [Gambusia affinis]
MSGHPPQRRQSNVGSLILSQQDNESLFNYLGRKCITLSSGVVQVYTAERNSSWNKRCCGVACLVKDNPQRSYFIRVLDIREGKMMFEQELYNGFIGNLQKAYFITFAGDTCQVGLNFASEDETKRFHVALTELTVKRNRKTEKRRDPPNGPALPMATVDIKHPEISNSHRIHNNSQMNNLVHGSFPMRLKKDKAKKKKLTKADIGTPSNFQHVNHIGWNPNTGFDMNNLDPELKNLFDLAGISEAQLKDKETSKAIYDFIEKNGGVEAVKNEQRRSSAPAASAASRASSSALPGGQWRGRQIREGAQLKKVDQKERPVSTGGGGGRDALLDQIRQGVQLKAVSVHLSHTPEPSSYAFFLQKLISSGFPSLQRDDNSEQTPTDAAPTAGIVGALMAAMQKRSKAIHSSDDDDDDDDDDDFEEEDEWDDDVLR